MEDTEITIDSAKHALWNNGLLKWKLWPQQCGIYEKIRGLPRDVQTVVMLCARQFGKSYLGVTLGVEDCIRNPGVSVMIVGPTITQTVDIVHQGMRKLMLDAPDGLIRRSKSESRWYIGSSELLIGGFDINNATRQRGKSVYRIYIEELVDSNPDSYHDSIRSDLGPALTHSPDAKIIYLTTLPKIPDHPFIIDTMPDAQLNGAFYSFTIEDNDQLTLEQKAACAALCGGIDSIDYQREYMNKMVRDQSIMVVPRYDEVKHVRPFTSPIRANMHITIDWGGVKDKTCALLHTYDFLSNRHLIIDELVWEANTSTKIIVDAIYDAWILFPNGQYIPEDHPHFPTIYADAPGQLLVDLIVEYEFPVKQVPKSDWLSAVNQMATKFSEEDRIYIHPKCIFLRQSCRSGTFNKNRTDFERTKALGHCDALAALMYAVRVQNTLSPFHETIPCGVIYDSVESLNQVKQPVLYSAGLTRKFGTLRNG